MNASGLCISVGHYVRATLYVVPGEFMETQPNPNIVPDNVKALPLIEIDRTSQIIDNKTALQTDSILTQLGSTIPERTQVQAHVVYQEVLEEMGLTGEHRVITMLPTDLRSAIARAAIRGTAQAVNDIGSVLRDIENFRSIFDTTAPDTKS